MIFSTEFSFSELLNAVADDKSNGAATAGGFCSYLKGRAKGIGTKSVCNTLGTSAFEVFNNLCNLVVGEVADVADEAILGPAFDPFCGKLVEIAKTDFGTDLDESFKAAENISTKIATRLCGEYLCPGKVQDVCDFAEEVRDAGVKLASVVCTLKGGAENMASGASVLCFPAGSSVIMEDGAQKLMSELRIGDRVKVGDDLYSEVSFYTIYRSVWSNVQVFQDVQTDQILPPVGFHVDTSDSRHRSTVPQYFA